MNAIAAKRQSPLEAEPVEAKPQPLIVGKR